MATKLNVIIDSQTYLTTLNSSSFSEITTTVRNLLRRNVPGPIPEFAIHKGDDSDIEIEDSDEFGDLLNDFEEEQPDETPSIIVKYERKNNNVMSPNAASMQQGPRAILDANVPRPADVNSKHVKMHSAVLTWVLPSDNNNDIENKDEDSKFNQNGNNNNGKSKYSFEIESNGKTIATVSSKFIKLAKLRSNQNYSFRIRTIVPINGMRNYRCSDWKSVKFMTTKRTHLNTLQQYPPSPPKYLHVTSLRPTSCVLRWTHDTNDLKNGKVVGLDCEYFIKSIGNEYNNKIVAHTYNESMIQLNDLQANKTYKFVVIARYWDVSVDIAQTTDNGYPMSDDSNCVTLTTPSEATDHRHYMANLESPNEDEIEWDTLNNCRQLRLFWNAPQSFKGNIIYRVIDENEGRGITGRITRLPVILELPHNRRRKEVFSSAPGRYNFSIYTYMIVPSDLSNDYQEHTVESREKSEFEIAIGSDYKDVSSKDFIKTKVNLKSENGNDRSGFIRVNKLNGTIFDVCIEIEKVFGLGSETLNEIVKTSTFDVQLFQGTEQMSKKEHLLNKREDFSKFLNTHFGGLNNKNNDNDSLMMVVQVHLRNLNANFNYNNNNNSNYNNMNMNNSNANMNSMNSMMNNMNMGTNNNMNNMPNYNDLSLNKMASSRSNFGGSDIDPKTGRTISVTSSEMNSFAQSFHHN